MAKKLAGTSPFLYSTGLYQNVTCPANQRYALISFRKQIGNHKKPIKHNLAQSLRQVNAVHSHSDCQQHAFMGNPD